VGTIASLNLVTKIKYCDMTPESRNISLLSNGGKQVTAEMCMHATIEELPFLCNGEVNTSVTIEELLGNGVFYVVRAEML
jgi:hypothetical protein